MDATGTARRRTGGPCRFDGRRLKPARGGGYSPKLQAPRQYSVATSGSLVGPQASRLWPRNHASPRRAGDLMRTTLALALMAFVPALPGAAQEKRKVVFEKDIV